MEGVRMPFHYYGFTNRILAQDVGDTTNLFVPVYVILKIKSMQSLNVQDLSGSINAVLIVNVLIEGLPDPLVHLLSNSMEMQINRAETIFLRENKEQSIVVSSSKKMLRFTIRRTLTGTLH
jgi:hypothetical protein